MAGLDIQFEELKQLLETKNITLIDVRNKDELSVDGKFPYPSVINIPVADLRDALQMDDDHFQATYGVKKPNKDELVVFSCRSGKRAADAQKTAKLLGYTQTRLYAGSFNDWCAQGGPYITD